MTSISFHKAISALAAAATTGVLLSAVVSLADAPPSAIGNAEAASAYSRQTQVAESRRTEPTTVVALAADRPTK